MNKTLPRLGRLEAIAFISGFCLMVYELAGARILAPTIGSSTYVWTSVIGVIIAALSLGYWAGGKLADTRHRYKDIVTLCLASSISIIYTMITYGGLLEWVAASFDDPRLQGVVASLVLFAPTSFILGLLSPYLAKLNVQSLETSGSRIASLSALNSIGGIVGTFITGFVLFGYIGSHETFGIVATLMLLSSWLLLPRERWRTRAAISGIVVLYAVSPVQAAYGLHIDTPSAHYVVYDGQYKEQPIRGISTGPHATQSGVDIRNPDRLVFWYTQQISDIIAERHEPPRSVLFLGGGTFTLPQHVAKAYPDTQIDVVEIDPKLAGIAREHFFYQDPHNVQLIFNDARTYVNQTDKVYDVVVVDVYGDVSVPFGFMTREYGERIHAITAEGGVVITNMVAGLQGECGALFSAMDAPYRQYFSYARYSVEDSSKVFANHITTYSKQPFDWRGSSTLSFTDQVLYTDNYTPAERMQQACRKTADI